MGMAQKTKKRNYSFSKKHTRRGGFSYTELDDKSDNSYYSEQTPIRDTPPKEPIREPAAKNETLGESVIVKSLQTALDECNKREEDLKNKMDPVVVESLRTALEECNKREQEFKSTCDKESLEKCNQKNESLKKINKKLVKKNQRNIRQKK